MVSYESCFSLTNGEVGCFQLDLGESACTQQQLPLIIQYLLCGRTGEEMLMAEELTATSGL